jgi:hypothetical protein
MWGAMILANEALVSYSEQRDACYAVVFTCSIAQPKAAG